MTVARCGALDDDLVRARTGRGDVQREVAKADADVQQVRDRAARDQARLDAGRAPPRTCRPSSTS